MNWELNGFPFSLLLSSLCRFLYLIPIFCVSSHEGMGSLLQPWKRREATNKLPTGYEAFQSHRTERKQLIELPTRQEAFYNHPERGKQKTELPIGQGNDFLNHYHHHMRMIVRRTEAKQTQKKACLVYSLPSHNELLQGSINKCQPIMRRDGFSPSRSIQ